MKIFVDNIPEGVKSITFDISFHNTFDGGHVSTAKEVLYGPTQGEVQKTETQTVPLVPDVKERPAKEVPSEMQDLEF